MIKPHVVFENLKAFPKGTVSSRYKPPNIACTRRVGVGAFFNVFMAWSWFRQNGMISSRPPAGNASRWALDELQKHERKTLMGYLDGGVDGKFKTTEDGIVLFFPAGIFGKGYIVPTDEKKQEIRKQLKRFSFFMLTIVIISTFITFQFIKFLLLPWWIAGLIYLAIVVGVSLAGRRIEKRLTSGLTQIDQKITLAEVYQNSAKSHDPTVLGILELTAVVFIIFGISIIFDEGMAWYLRLIGVLSVIFCGLCSIAIGYMIKVKNKG